MQATRRPATLVVLAALGLAPLGIATPAAAGPTLSLSSTADLSNLTVGELVPISVTLTGLPSPNNSTDFIFNLNSSVIFSSSLLTAVPDPTSTSGLTATVAPGSVFGNPIQGPLQVANFNAQSSLTSGKAVGDFSESPNLNSGAIGLNGTYFTFTVQAAAVGSGSISFDATPGSNEYAANDTGFNFAPMPTGGSLNFTVHTAPATTAPEPSSVAAFAFTGLGAMGLILRARKRQAVA